MKTWFFIGTFVAICWGGTSCITKMQAEVTRTDSLFTELENLEVTLVKMDVGKIDKLVIDYDRASEIFIEAIKDTLPKEDYFTLSDMKRARKALNSFHLNFSFYEKELLKSKEQLDNLKIDLRGDRVSKVQFKEYFKSEINAFNDLYEGIANLQSWHNSAMEKEAKVAPRVNELAKRLNLDIEL